MNSHGIPLGSVVVGVDGSDQSDEAVAWAARHAAREARTLVLVHAVDSTTTAAAWMVQGGVDPTPYLEQADTAGTLVLHDAHKLASDVAAELTVKELQVRSDPRSALLAASEGARTLVVGSRGLGPLKSILLGSVGTALVRHAACPVVVVRPHRAGMVRNGVLVGADGTHGSVPVLDFAFRQASELDLPLTVMHTVFDGAAVMNASAEIPATEIGYDELALTLSETLVGLGEKYPEVSVTQHVVRGMPDTALLNLSKKMNLVVVGHHSRDIAQRLFFNSVSLGIVEHAATVVAVVPQD